MVILEAFGTGLIVEPYIPNIVLAGNLLSKLGSDDQKKEILPKLFSGELQMSFAFTEPQSRFDVNDVTTSAKLEGDNYIIDGYKAVVMNGPASDKFIVSCRTSGSQLDEDGISLLIVDKDSKGLSSRDYSNVDGSKASEVTLENVSVPTSNLLSLIHI